MKTVFVGNHAGCAGVLSYGNDNRRDKQGHLPKGGLKEWLYGSWGSFFRAHRRPAAPVQKYVRLLPT